MYDDFLKNCRDITVHKDGNKPRDVLGTMSYSVLVDCRVIEVLEIFPLLFLYSVVFFLFILKEKNI